MSKNKLVLALAVIWLLVGISLLSFYSKFDWNVLLGFATWVLAGGVGAAIWQIIVTRENTNEQLRETRKSTNAQIAVELFRELRGKETVKVFRLIYSLKPDDINNLSTFNKRQIDSVLDKFEMIGALVNEEILDKSIAIEVFAGPPALRCWYQLVKYIREEKKARGFFVKHYEPFTRTTLEYFYDKGIEVNLRLISVKDPIPLVKTFFEWRDKGDVRWPRSLEEIEQDRKAQQKSEKDKNDKIRESLKG